MRKFGTQISSLEAKATFSQDQLEAGKTADSKYSWCRNSVSCVDAHPAPRDLCQTELVRCVSHNNRPPGFCRKPVSSRPCCATTACLVSVAQGACFPLLPTLDGSGAKAGFGCSIIWPGTGCSLEARGRLHLLSENTVGCSADL